MKHPNPYQFLYSIRPCELGAFLKFLLRVSRREYAFDGQNMWLDPASDLGVRLLAEGDYEPAMGRCLRELLKAGDTFLDVGANEGWFSILAARLVGSGGRVFCVEPQERLWPVILHNLALNRLTNCVLLPYAISSNPGSAALTLTPTMNSGASTLVPSTRQSLWRKQRVVTTALDSIAELRRGPNVSLAKVDVEGFEVEVVRSAARLIAERRISRWLIETHPPQLQQLGSSVGELESTLQRHGYRQRTVEETSVWELE